MDLTPIAQLATRYADAPSAGKERDALLSLPNLSVLKRDAPSGLDAMLYDPVICLILQGSKSVSAGAQTVTLTPGDALVVSHDLPVVSRITRASASAPYLALILTLDTATIRGLYDQLSETAPPDTAASPLAAAPADPAWLEPLARYLALSRQPLDAAVLGPATLREIHYRLLLSPIGASLRALLRPDSHASRIARAIHKLRAEFRTPLAMPDLALSAGMSLSSFHAHFKAVTGTTPLQYLKDLRLIEARTLLATGEHSVSQAAFAVGYESPTHFSRDFSRKFDHPPSRIGAPPGTPAPTPS